MTQLLSEEDSNNILDQFKETRKKTLELFQPLKVEDAVMQSDPFGSPPNWHLAHVTWFFHKILEKHGKKLDDLYEGINMAYLNSYYQRYGNILPKSERGKYPRPTVEETLKYRSIVDKEVISFIDKRQKTKLPLDQGKDTSLSNEIHYDITLGIQHEMQHQELMIYDFQNYFQRFLEPDDNYKPKIVKDLPPSPLSVDPVLQNKQNEDLPIGGMVKVPGGIYDLGFNGKGFCYDNELPEHKVYLQPFLIDVTHVTNGQFMQFIKAGGYQDYKYWLADGWDLVQEQEWNAPLYWEQRDGEWMKKDFRGLHKIEPEEPVINVSYYEADAYARWARKRLPTEAEWEKAASWNDELQRKTLYPWGNEAPTSKHANLLESYIWGPTKIGSYPQGKSYYGCHQMIGDVWEWTSSEYVLYPGFTSKFSEYTDKWAINQKVLRGGCFATPYGQARNSYRNYFKPHERILFAGFRCAKG